MPPTPQRSRTMPNVTVPPPGVPQGPPPGAHRSGRPDGEHFERVPSGYHPVHVDDYIRRLLGELKAAEKRAEELARAAVREVSSTPQGRELLADLIKLAADEITGQKEAAAAEGAQIIADARAEAEAIIARANDESGRMAAGAREQADAVVSTARASASELLDQATLRATAVTDHAQRRLDALTQLHDQTLGQLRRVHEVAGGTLEMEEKRGSLADEVARAMGESPAAQPAALEAPGA